MNFLALKKNILYLLIILAAIGLAVQIAMSNLIEFKTVAYLLVMGLAIFFCGRLEDNNKTDEKE